MASVIKNIIVSELSAVLKEVVEDFHEDQLHLDFAGHIQLKDIHLKREALSRLEMPVVVKYGHIGRLDIAVPYVTLLAGSPIQVSIEEMFLVVGPLVSRGNDFDPKEYRMLMRAAKQAANEEDYREEERKEVEEHEAFKERNKKKKSDETQKSLVESIIEAIVANLQVNIRHVHIRYEHHFAGYHPGKPETPFAVGITLDQLFLRPCDQAGKVGKAGKGSPERAAAGSSTPGSSARGGGAPERGALAVTTTYRMVFVHAFAMYWDERRDRQMSDADKEEFRRMIETEDDLHKDGFAVSTQHTFLLAPTTLKMMLTQREIAKKRCELGAIRAQFGRNSGAIRRNSLTRHPSSQAGARAAEARGPPGGARRGAGRQLRRGGARGGGEEGGRRRAADAAPHRRGHVRKADECLVLLQVVRSAAQFWRAIRRAIRGDSARNSGAIL